MLDFIAPLVKNLSLSWSAAELVQLIDTDNEMPLAGLDPSWNKQDITTIHSSVNVPFCKAFFRTK